MTRLGQARLRSAGTGRTRATVPYRVPRDVGSRDGIAYCVRGQLRLGLGRSTGLTRRCGARRLLD